MGAMQVTRLLNAYLRRKEWEHRALSAQIIGLLGQAMGGKSTPSSVPPANIAQANRRALLAMGAPI